MDPVYWENVSKTLFFMAMSVGIVVIALAILISIVEWVWCDVLHAPKKKNEDKS